MNTEQLRQELHWKHRPFPELVRLGWPIVTSLLSYSLMTLVDALFVGRLGAHAIAATGLGATAVFGVLCFGVGLFAGGKVQVSQAVGAGDSARLKPLLGGFLRLALWLGLVFVACGWAVALALPLVSSGDSGQWAQSYCRIRALAMPASLLVCAIGQYRQALGDSRTAMRATLIANLVHIPLNYALIFGAQLGVAGAAWASVACTLVEAAILIRAQGQLGFGWHAGSLREALQTFRFGLPAAFERWLDVGAFAALVVLIAKAGPMQLAAHQITLQILHFCFLPVMALSDAVCVLVAQAVGAREPGVARRVVGYGLKTGLAFGALSGASLLLCGKFLLAFFTSDVDLISTAFRVVQVAVLLQLINAVFLVLKGALRGFGALRYVAWVTVGCAWLFTPPLTWLFAYQLGLGAAGGWLALTVEVCVGSALVFWRLQRHAALQHLQTGGAAATAVPAGMLLSKVRVLLANTVRALFQRRRLRNLL